MTATSRPRRADAERNREGILDAAVRCLTTSPRASMAEIAEAAGVGRVTMYGHFSSRGELVAAVFGRTMDRADESLSQLDLEGDPMGALKRLVAASWRIVGDSRLLLQAATEELGPDAVRHHHAEPLSRVSRLVRRGRRTGAFRTDLPQDWLITCFYSVLHAAADDLASGRLSERSADRVVWPTIASLFRPSAPAP